MVYSVPTTGSLAALRTCAAPAQPSRELDHESSTSSTKRHNQSNPGDRSGPPLVNNLTNGFTELRPYLQEQVATPKKEARAAPAQVTDLTSVAASSTMACHEPHPPRPRAEVAIYQPIRRGASKLHSFFFGRGSIGNAEGSAAPVARLRNAIWLQNQPYGRGSELGCCLAVPAALTSSYWAG